MQDGHDPIQALHLSSCIVRNDLQYRETHEECVTKLLVEGAVVGKLQVRPLRR